ncbi:MAG: VWA domain-containing protein [Phycisphaerae bacterium]
MAISLPFDFEQPMWLWLCGLVPILAVASLRSLAGLDPVRRVLAIVVRSLVIILLACCLARIQRVQRNDSLTVMFLMDRSHSVQALEGEQETFIRKAAADIPPRDRVGLIDFARDASLEQLPLHGGYFIQPGRLPVMTHIDRTNVAAAMRLAMAMFPHDSAKRIVLMSDGNDNMGDVLGEARRAKADGIPVDIVPLRYERSNEVYFDRMIAPSHAEPGEQVPIRLVLHSERRTTGRITIIQNGELVNLPEANSRVTLRPGDNTFYVKLPVTRGGAQTFEAVFHPDDEDMDGTARNNRAFAFSFVSGKSRALLVTANPRHDQVLYEALRSEDVLVEMVRASDLGDFGLLQMMNYATIILANVPAAAFTDQQQKDFATYVKDMGSGLIMTGGDEGFGAGGWIGGPVEEVMPVSFEIKHKRVIPRGALALIMHSCEIPRGNYWAKEMAKKSVDTISSQDYFGVLAYSYSPGGENWEVPLDLNVNKAAVKARIGRLQVGDMPAFGPTMQMAYDELTKGRGRDAAQKHVIILSDGDAQPPPNSLLRDYASKKITVSTIAIGWGAHAQTGVMQKIARDTGGKFYAARNPRQLPQIFVKESKVVRRPLIVDEPFQPQIMDAYSDLLAGVAADDILPLLGGMVMTSAKMSPNVVIPMVRSTDDGEDPVLAHWQFELGKTVAFTSGYWPKWGEAWMPWPKFAKLWAQIVRWSMRQDTPASFDTFAKVEGGRGRIVIDALDKDASYLNQLQLPGNVVGPDRQPVPIKFAQTGPGHYEAEVDIAHAGQYLSNIQVFGAEGQALGTIRTGFSVPFSPEYRDLIPNEALLRQVAEITGGRWLDGEPEEADIFSHDLPPTEATRPAWEWVLAWLLLPLFLLDVAVRRLASWLALSIAVELVLLVVLIFGLELYYTPWWSILGALLFAEVVGWTIRFRSIGPLFDFMTHTVTALRHTGDRSTVALEQLKSKREQVREELESGGRPGGRRAEEEPSALPRGTAKRRYDVGDREGAKPAGDLTEALGGAKAGPEKAKKTEKPAEDGAEETSTSRLLKAKQRAKRKQDDQD